VTYPRDRIRMILFIGFFAPVTVLPAGLLIGVWFLMQLFSQVGSVANASSGGVAYMAHVAGSSLGPWSRDFSSIAIASAPDDPRRVCST